MRIAICTDMYLPQLSGISDSIEILAHQLRKNGHTVRIYAPNLMGAVPEEGTVRLPSFEIPGSGGGLALVFPFGVVRDMRAFKPDVIHTHTFSTIGFCALYASWRLKVPLVGTDHTFPTDYLYYVGLNIAPFRFLIRTFASWYYNRAAFVTAPSESMLSELVRYGMYAPHQVVSNHIPSNLFKPLQSREALKTKYGVDSNAVLIFGRIAKEKNLEYALDIFERTVNKTDAKLVFVGGGPYQRELEALVAKKAYAKRVQFLGVLRGEALVEAINACEVFLITSKSETQSMTTLQAMACTVPVVAIAAGGLPEYVHDGQNGYCIKEEEKELFVERVVSLLEDSTQRELMGQKGRESIAKYSPEVITKEFEKIYAEVTKDATLTA